MVINMSLGGEELAPAEAAAIDAAVEAGVIVVASAGNEGDAGMGYPGAYQPVISVGSAGWTDEWLDHGAGSGAPANGSRYRMFWLRNVRGNGDTRDLRPPLKTDPGDTGEQGAGLAGGTYVSSFSSRVEAGQDLDVLAPARGSSARSRASTTTSACHGGRRASATCWAGTRATASTWVARRWPLPMWRASWP